MNIVLVLDANQRSALAVTRSLGRKNITVLTADESHSALAGSSHHSGQYLIYPSPRLDPDHFVESLKQLVKEYHIDILLPMTELTTTLLLVNRSEFHDVVIPFPNLDTVDSLADKCSLMRLADNLNVPVPGTRYCNPVAQDEFYPEELNYPVVLKPGKSWQHQNGSWYRAGVRTAHNPRQLEEIIATDRSFQGEPYMLQEYIEGQGQGIFALYDNGAPVAFFAHRRLREKPPSGGVSVLSESISADPVLVSHARALLDSVHWHGVAMVEFKVARDGTPNLMEINTRFWGSLQLAIDAGVDFPYLLYQIACSKKPEPVVTYKTGIRLRWLLGDLDSLYLTLRDSQYSMATKIKAILHFLTPTPFKLRHEVDRWSDPGPAWYEVKQYIRDILG